MAETAFKPTKLLWDNYIEYLIDAIIDISADRIYSSRPYFQLGKNIWGYSIKKHIIFYKEEDNEILIIRILHCSMDIKRHLLYQ